MSRPSTSRPLGLLTVLGAGIVGGAVGGGCAGERPAEGRSDRARAAVEPSSFVVEADGALAMPVGRDVVRVRTRAVERGGVSTSDGAVERFIARGDGAEQTWTFDREPSGDGDLIVRVGVDDLTFVGTSACGAQYRSEETGNGICYGRATWVDARGVRSEVPWSIDRNGIAMRVRDEVLEASAYPAVLDPIIGPEIEVGDFAWGPTVAHERWLDAAAGQGSSLAVWIAEPHDDWGQPGTSSVRARRLDGAGHAVGAPVEVFEGGWLSRVAYGGGVFRVFAYDATGTRMARVTAEGEVLDPAGVALAEGVPEDASCAPDGSCVLLGALVTRVTPDGATNGGIVVPIDVVGWGRVERVATGFRLVLPTQDGVFVSALEDGSDALVEPVALWPHVDELPEIVRRADGSVIVTSCSPQGLRWGVLDAALERVVPDGVVVDWCGAGLQATGRGFAVADQDGRLVEVDVEDGTVREASLGLSAETMFTTSVAAAPGAATWLRVEGASASGLGWMEDVRGVAVELETLTPTADELVSVGLAPQMLGRPAGGTVGHAVAFRDYRRGVRDERDRLRFFDASGEPLPGPSVEIAGRASAWPWAAVARNSEHTVALWTERVAETGDRELLLRRFDPAGTSPDETPLSLGAIDGSELAVEATDELIVVATAESGGSRIITVPVAATLVPGAPVQVPPSWSVNVARRGDEIWIMHDDALSRVAADGALLAVATPTDAGAWGYPLGCDEMRCMVATSGAETTTVSELHSDGTTGPILYERVVVGPVALTWNGDSFTFVGGRSAPDPVMHHDVTWLDDGSAVDDGTWSRVSSVFDWTSPAIAGLGDGATIAVYQDVETMRLSSRALRAEPGDGGGGGAASSGGSGGLGGVGEGGAAAAGGAGGDGGSSSSGGGGGYGGREGDGGGPTAASSGSGGGGDDASATGATAGGGEDDASGGHGGSTGDGSGGAGIGGSVGSSGGDAESTTAAGSTSGETTSTSTGPSTSTGGGAFPGSTSGAGGTGGGPDGSTGPTGGGCSCGVPPSGGGSALAAVAGVLSLAWQRRSRRALRRDASVGGSAPAEPRAHRA